MQEVPFSVSNKWYNGECHVLTYQLDELVGTKLRALYQRRKGRDLYDLYKALTLSDVNIAHVLACYQKYMEFVVDHVPTYKEFIINMMSFWEIPSSCFGQMKSSIHIKGMR